jgi:hypothetical protein
MASAWLNTWLNSWGNSWGTVTTAQSSGDSRKRKDEKKKHSSIYEIQEKANRELIKLYEKIPEVLEQSAPIEISIPAPKIKPSEALVTVPVLPIPEPVIPKIQPLNIPVYMPVSVKPTKQVIEQKISIPDEMDDEEAIAAVLALLQEVEA